MRTLGLAAICLLLLITLRLVWLHHNDPAKPCDPDLGEVCLQEDARLFAELQARGLFQPGPNGTLLFPKPEVLAEPALAHKVLDSKDRKTLQSLYGSAQGTIVRKEIELWNLSRQVAGLRHRFAAGKSAAPLRWTLSDCDSGVRLNAHRRVSEDFGFVHGGIIKTGFSEWTAVQTQGECVRWQATIFADNRSPIELQILGELNAVPANTSVKTLALNAKQANKRAKRCEPAAASSGALQFRLNQWQENTEQSASTNAAQWMQKINLEIKPTIINTDNEAGLAIKRDQLQACEFVWQGIPLNRSSAASNPQIVSADGEVLYEKGKPTELTQRLGLVPLVGFGLQDSRSLAGILHSNNLPNEEYKLTLNVDSRHQAAAHSSLTSFVENKLKNLNYKNKRRAAFVTLDADTGEVLAVAGWPLPPAQSDVTDWDLAAFSRNYPLDDPLQVWGLEGSGYHFAPGSTFKPVTATAAILAAAAGNGSLQTILGEPSQAQYEKASGLKVTDTAYVPYKENSNPKLSSFAECNSKHCFQLRNDQREPLSKVAERRLTEECPKPGRAANHYGLVPAVASSNNIWFARAATLADGDAINAYDNEYKARFDKFGGRAKAPPMPELYLQKAATLLGVGPSASPLMALNNAPEHLQATHRMTVPAGNMDLFPPADANGERKTVYPARWRLTQTAIGQAMNIPPIQQARMALRIASGKALDPTLIKAWHDTPVAAQDIKPFDANLTPLRRGMKAVAETGTAALSLASVMPELKCSMRGKTGTAEIREPVTGNTYNSGWFVGWNDPASLPPEPSSADAVENASEKNPISTKPRRIAFACMVSHIYGDYKYGGKTCGIVVANYFKTLKAEGLL